MSDPREPIPTVETDMMNLANALSANMFDSWGENGGPDAAVAEIEGLLPVFYMGRAAMALTGKDSIPEALRKLFKDEDLQDTVIHDGKELEKMLRRSHETGEIVPRRIGELVEHASAGSIQLEFLEPGELITLVYDMPKYPGTLAVMEVTRNTEGDEPNRLSVTIAEAKGEALEAKGRLLKKKGETLTTGSSVYLGCEPQAGEFELQLQQGAYPVWTDRVYAEGGDWNTGWLRKDTDFILQQAYFGPTNRYPLFHSAQLNFEK